MTTIEQLMRRRMWANRLSRWVALMFFVLATSFYAMDSDIAKFLLPIRSIALFGLLIAGVLFVVQFIEFRRYRSHPPIVVVTGIVLSFSLAGYVYLREFAAYRETEFTFVNDGITFAGTLYLPHGEGVYTGAVIAPGSVRASRRLYHVWADILVRNGIAVLNFDKRGTGDSEGVYEEEDGSSAENLSRLASDVRAAVDALRQNREIDPLRVGIVGMSLGGWTAAIAADSLEEVAFMVMLSGPSVSVGEEDYFNQLVGHTPPLPRDSILSMIRQRGSSGFDPYGILARIDIPTLWLFGNQDLSIPVPACTTVLDTMVQKYDRPYVNKIYETANHLLVEQDWPFDFPDGLEQEIITFIRQMSRERR